MEDVLSLNNEAVGGVRFLPEEGLVARGRGPARSLTVACILDEFSFQSFSPEAEFVPLTPGNWLIELSASQPDLLLVESAWRGHKGSWWNTVPRFGPELRGILAWCRERGIPTAFWNKEDPVHFPTFLHLASAFDAVFTTDMDCVPRYKARLGHDRAFFLPFAAQPELHNPLQVYDRVDGCAFAGAYYKRYPHRTKDLDELSKTILNRMRLDIYDRNHGLDVPDYVFPESYRQHIVGTLRPHEIGAAYKGYRVNLNLNSVKQSQSMFARRVYELLASNTLVVSNFSRGLRTMFGDLTVCTDDGAELDRQLDALETTPFGVERLRAMGLRKVMAEHTYAERLSYVARACGLDVDDVQHDAVLVVAGVSSAAELERVRSALARQAFPLVKSLLVLRDGFVPAEGAVPADCLVVAAAEKPDLGAIAERVGAAYVALFSPDDHYGASYLTDAVQALTWADVPAVGRGRHFRAVDGRAVLTGAGAAFRPCEAMPVRLAVLRAQAVEGMSLDLREPEGLDRPVDGLAIGPFNYCRDGAELEAEALADLADLDVHQGSSLAAMRRHADSAVAVAGEEEGAVDLAMLFGGMPDGGPDISLGIDESGLRLVSTLPDGTFRYLYSDTTVGTAVLPPVESPWVYFECDPGVDVTLTLIFLSAAGDRLGHAMVLQMRNNRVVAPEGTTSVRVGLRIAGPGSTTVRRYLASEYHELSTGVMPTARDLVLTNVYPSYDRLYRNGFVHTRVRSYRDYGERVDVALPTAGPKSSYREFQGVDVAEVSAELLSQTLATGEIDNVLVHFLDPGMWAVLRDQKTVKGVYVWVHGAEVQPWWRREYNYADEESLARAKEASAERLAFWWDVFSNLPDNVHFVFVSRYFAEEVFEDVGVRLPEERYSIIHNPIDTAIFTYVPKPAEQCRRILTIRPYASRKYANDLSVEAVRILSERDGFEELQFCFVGDGPLFDEVLEPLRGLPNVEIRREFLNHGQIADLHQDYGVFLTPTRMDAQGVSRDEAMASGLVPVTTAVAAVPEFVDETCGYLAPPEDAVALAEAIWELAHDPDRFQRMSEAATRRVARQTAADVVIPREISLFTT